MGSLKVLIKALVATFYKDNIGFFLVVLYLAFVLMRSTEHIALATAIATSLPLTLFTLLLWALYWLKAIGFMYKTINTSTYSFIRQLPLYSKLKQFIWLFIVTYIIGQPAWAYAVFISVFNFKHATYGLFALMMAFLFIANSFMVLAIMYMLQRPMREPSLGLWHKFISKKLSLPYPLWYVRHLFVHEPMLAFLTKAGSLMLLSGTFYLFTTDVYDWRLLGVGILFAFIINSMLIYNYYEFTIKNYWVYNLPRTHSQIIFTTLITNIILFLPETLFILFHLPQNIAFIHWGGLLLFQTFLSYFLFSSLLFKPIAKEDYGKRIFYLMVLLIFVLMYSTPLLFINLILLAFGIWIMGNYYRYHTNLKL
ncbi:MAG: hypothetical protein L3J06_09765 [Cyclobacteriaceae bacterium]|nr:hypothetical protein [Cyclobacteriaceae bacterium]